MRAVSGEGNLLASSFPAALVEFLFQSQPALAMGAFLFQRGKNGVGNLPHRTPSKLLLMVLPTQRPNLETLALAISAPSFSGRSFLRKPAQQLPRPLGTGSDSPHLSPTWKR
jgi:hypothetical protein